MGTTTLLEIIQTLDDLDPEATIYAATPWTESSKAIVMNEEESRHLPSEIQKLGLKYFLEVSIANDFLQGFAANSEVDPSIQQKCSRLIQYAINDA